METAETKNEFKDLSEFVEFDNDRWYKIVNYDRMDPFFITLTGDTDLWAFISTNGSLAAGRGNQEQSFFPYETVDKIHRRGENVGPRTWVLYETEEGPKLWEPLVRRLGMAHGPRVLYKNLLGTKVLWEETLPDGKLCFRQQWALADQFGLVRKVSLSAPLGPVRAKVLDGMVQLLPAGVPFATTLSFSNLIDAYCWNEALDHGRLGIFTMYAQLWDRAEPKESWVALAAWYSGLGNCRTLLSSTQTEAFCLGENSVSSETLTRGRKPAFLLTWEQTFGSSPTVWYQVMDSPLSQTRVADLAAWLENGGGTPLEIEAAVEKTSRDLADLLVQADGFQQSADLMSATHHTANVLFNIMRGGVFPSGTRWESQDLGKFIGQRNRRLVRDFEVLAGKIGDSSTRAVVLREARAVSPQLERLVREYLPITFSRRHGDPSRPWNKFSIKVRDPRGNRILNFEGNWRDIFQNWEALVWSHPDYTESVISVFLSSMTPDGHNPYRITRAGVDWEVIEPDDPWSFIGYWGDHQVVYLLKLLEFSEASKPGVLEELWNRPVFSFANVPYRIKSYNAQLENPKATIVFDRASHDRAIESVSDLGGDGRLVLGRDGMPVLGTLGEKLVVILLSKAGNLVPGGGIWMNTQRPEWNDANNALVGQGLSMVTLAWFRRFLAFLLTLPFLDSPVDLPEETASALEALSIVLKTTPSSVQSDPRARKVWLDRVGPILEEWRSVAYSGWADRKLRSVDGSLVRSVASLLVGLADTSLLGAHRTDGLFDSYNVLTIHPDQLEVSGLYAMLEGQVAVISSGVLTPAAVLKLAANLKTSGVYDEVRRSYRLYPDRILPRFLERNKLDRTALALGPVQRLLADHRADVLEVQKDGTIRFAPGMANRFDVETVLQDWGPEKRVVADCFDRLMNHREFTGRSGTMFAFEGLGCIYWHMVAKLLLAVQEVTFTASDRRLPEVPALVALYREIRAGLGYKKTPEEYGAFPFDPYSHTPGEGGAQQPGMTGQVKEEILTRWGELGIRWKAGKLYLDPVLFETDEIPGGGELAFTYCRIPFRYIRSETHQTRVRTEAGWSILTNTEINPQETLEVEVSF